ncbi:unnamed protein product [Pleuronectes platessa]|uniref:Uncharacterized protein n=1 Tax=Pleuronectes platessa TaxID=8262 RepID=A0A9N7W0L5_PLEPL|nr:unnamed protein product [Pleuronectes platessa]
MKLVQVVLMLTSLKLPISTMLLLPQWRQRTDQKEELHDASKRVRKASTSGDKGSCSGHVDEQNRLPHETSSATASQLHRQLAKPGQEAGTAAAAGQVARQPERELATAPAVTDTRSKTRNREEEENQDMVVMWGFLDN